MEISVHTWGLQSFPSATKVKGRKCLLEGKVFRMFCPHFYTTHNLWWYRDFWHEFTWEREEIYRIFFLDEKHFKLDEKVTYLGFILHPCRIREAKVNQRELWRENWLSNVLESRLHGWGFCHSWDENLCGNWSICYFFNQHCCATFFQNNYFLLLYFFIIKYF